jgi:hypothetical protein
MVSLLLLTSRSSHTNANKAATIQNMKFTSWVSRERAAGQRLHSSPWSYPHSHMVPHAWCRLQDRGFDGQHVTWRVDCRV